MVDLSEESKLYCGIKSFVKSGDTQVMVTDKENKMSTIEDYYSVIGVMELLLNEKQFDYFKTHLLSGDSVIVDLRRVKIIVPKKKFQGDEISRQLSVDFVLEALENDENFNFKF